MTDQEKIYEINHAVNRLGIDEALKRLCPAGSGAESCSSDAKRGGQDVAEGRSREGGRVTPGEAEAALREIVDAMNDEAAGALEAVDRRRKVQSEDWVEGFETRAAALKDYAARIQELLPEPDSEQGGNAGDIKQSHGSPEANAGPNNGTVSGRRNATMEAPKQKK